MNNHNDPENSRNQQRVIHDYRFGPYYHVALYRLPDDGLSIGYQYQGVMLSPDPEGHFAREALKVFKKYGKNDAAEDFNHLLYFGATASGLVIHVGELGGRTYFDVGFDWRMCRLDATFPGGPLEQAIHALRRRFPDCTYG